MTRVLRRVAALSALSALVACAPPRDASVAPFEADEPAIGARRPSPPSPLSPPSTSAEPAPEVVLTRARLRQWIGRGPARVLAAIEFADRPVFRDGRFLGLRVLARRDEGLSRSLFDLRPGDVLVRVNGVPPRTPDDLVKAAQLALEAPAIVLEVVREGKPLELRVPVREQ